MKGEVYLHVRKMNQNKIRVFKPAYSSSGLWVAKASPSNTGHMAGTHPGQTPFCHWAHSTHAPRTQTGHWRHASSPHVHSSGTWQETGIPRGNSRRLGENVQPTTEAIFFLINVVIKWQWTKKTLLKDLLYILLRSSRADWMRF